MRPAITSSGELRARRQKTLLEMAAPEDLALGQGDVAEVLTGRAALEATETDELLVIDECPLLHMLSQCAHLYYLVSLGFGKCLVCVRWHCVVDCLEAVVGYGRFMDCA